MQHNCWLFCSLKSVVGGRVLTKATIGAFPLHGTVRFGTARYGTVRLSSGRLHFHRSLVPLKSGRDYSRVVIIAPPLLPWHHRKRVTNKLTTKKGDGIVFFILGMWMFLTTMERSMRMLVIYPQQQRLWCSDTGCRGGEQGCSCRCAALLD